MAVRVPRLAITLSVAAVVALTAAAASLAQRPPGPPPQEPPRSGPVTTISWVGDTIFVRGGGEANHLHVYVATSLPDETDELFVQPACTFAEEDRIEQEAETDEPAPCERQGRVVVDESAPGPDDDHRCYSGGRCTEVTSSTFKRIVVDTGGGDDEILFNVDRKPAISLGEGDDKSRAFVSGDELDGGPGADRLEGGGNGGSGNDHVVGEGKGGSGNDRLHLPKGSIGGTLDGGTGNDRLTTAAGESTLYGGAGRDVLIGSRSEDKLDGGAGRDRCDGRGPNPKDRRSSLWPYRDRAVRCEVVRNVP